MSLEHMIEAVGPPYKTVTRAPRPLDSELHDCVVGITDGLDIERVLSLSVPVDMPFLQKSLHLDVGAIKAPQHPQEVGGAEKKQHRCSLTTPLPPYTQQLMSSDVHEMVLKNDENQY